MFRHLQIWTCSCPKRSVFLLRETRHPVSENPGGQGVRRVRIQNGSPHPRETGLCSSSTRDWDQLRDEPLGSVPHVQASAVQMNDLKDRPQHVLNNTHLLNRLPWTLVDPIVRTQMNFLKSCFHQMHDFVKPFCSLVHKPFTHLNQHFIPARGFHQAAARLDYTWRDCLLPLNEKRCRKKLENNLKFYQWDAGRKGTKWASVLVSLCTVDEQPAFLFTLRSSTLKGRHKGDVSFAGGKSEPSDGDVVTTALREATEELGVPVCPQKVWGVLKPLRDASGMLVAPVLANVGPVEELTFKPNPGEVEEVFTLSVSHLCDPRNCGYTHFRTGDRYGYTLPVFCNGKHRVWGLTAVALDQALKLLLPP